MYAIVLLIIVALLYWIGELLSNSLTNLCKTFGLPEIVVGILLGFITSIPELITFTEAQRKEKRKNARMAIEKMKDDVILINTSRGALISSDDLIKGIRQHKFGGVGLDVYEEEQRNVFENREDDILETSITARLLSFPNVIVTSHQGFLTKEALEAISRTTLENAETFGQGKPVEANIVK